VTARRSAESDRADALEGAVAGVGAEPAVLARVTATSVQPDVAPLAAESRRTRTETTTVWSDVAQSWPPNSHTLQQFITHLLHGQETLKRQNLLNVLFIYMKISGTIAEGMMSLQI